MNAVRPPTFRPRIAPELLCAVQLKRPPRYAKAQPQSVGLFRGWGALPVFYVMWAPRRAAGRSSELRRSRSQDSSR
jgi:hypothetical protein